MKSSCNKETIERIYKALESGDNSVLAENVHADYTWRVAGQCSWSGNFKGSKAIVRDLIRPLFSRFASTYTAKLKSAIAEGDIVVAEVSGDVMTKDGQRYNNEYCFVFHFRDEKIASVTEYGDTDLEERVLGRYQDVRIALET